MPLDKPQLTAALQLAFEMGMDDQDWTLQQAAQAMADAIDAYVRTAEVTGIATEVTDPASAPIGTGAQVGTGSLI